MASWRGVLAAGYVAIFTLLPAVILAEEASEEPGEPIAAVQALLKHEHLYSGVVDGVMGNETIAAIRRYQILHGLRATGRLDTSTLRKMLAPPQPSAELSASDQQLLRELSEAPIPAPGMERRVPIPPGEPPPVAAGTPKDKKATHSKATRSRRSVYRN